MVPVAYNVRSLFVRKTTTIATAAGVGLVVFVLASALMLSEGITRTMASSGAPDRAIILRKGSDTELASGFETRHSGLALSAPGVKKDGAGQPLGSEEVVVVVALDKKGTSGMISNVQVRGVSERAFAVRPQVTVVEGRLARPGTDEAIVGKSVAGKFAGLEIGSQFDLKKNRPVTVVGVFDAGGSSFDSEVWTDLDTLRSSFGREGLVSSLTVQLENRSKLDSFKATVESDKQLALEAMGERDYYEKQSEGTSLFIKAIGIVIAVFFSFGAMIGATITMYAAVSQRGKEIATLKALGFSDGAILTSFLFESVVLAAAGGCVGLAGALLMGGVQFSMMNFATWQEVVFSFDATPRILGTALLFGGVMGIVGGFLPALRAAKTSPVEAMRA